MTGPANTDVQLSALPQAFMEDYRRWWKVENDCKMGADDPEYQRLCNAYEGGQHRVMVCGDAHDKDIPFAILKLCMVFGELQNLVANLSQPSYVADADDVGDLRYCLQGVRSAWAMLDGTDDPAVRLTREYADHVGIASKPERIRWKHEGYELPQGGEA